jgi:carbonic anhydrase/acetyltransferase-like protein (isoleucine patch superfamily)
MIRSYRGVLPVVHPTAYVDESVQVVGAVELGAESSVCLDYLQHV